MFAKKYFAVTYFAPRYFPPIGDFVPVTADYPNFVGFIVNVGTMMGRM